MKNKSTLKALIISILALPGPLYCTMPAYSAQKLQPTYPSSFYNRSQEHTHTINVIEGQLFTVTLNNQSSNGYTWYITEPFLEDYVQLLGKTIMPYRCTSSHGKTIFTFQAIKAGSEIIKFEYARPWSWTIAQRSTYTIIIRQKNAYTNPARPIFPKFMLPQKNHS